MNAISRIKEHMQVNCLENEPVGEVERVEDDWLTIRYQKALNNGRVVDAEQQLPLEWVYSVRGDKVRLNEPRQVIERERRDPLPEPLQDWEGEGGSPPDALGATDLDGVPDR